MTTPSCIAFSAILLATASLGVHAAAPGNDNPLYVGAALGTSGFSLPSSHTPVPSGGEKNDKSGTALKLYGGYRLTEHFGVEAGYARLGRVSQWTSVNGVAARQAGSGQVFYGAATGRLPIGESFALNGRLGVARGKVSGGNKLVPASQGIAGTATGVMIGFGAEYKVSQNVALTADYDYFGKMSKQVKGGMLTVGLRASF